MNLHRTLLSLAGLISAACFTGGVCHAAPPPPVVCFPSHTLVDSWIDTGDYIAFRQEKSALFPPPADISDRHDILPTVFPKCDAPRGYHPQPAHC